MRRRRDEDDSELEQGCSGLRGEVKEKEEVKSTEGGKGTGQRETRKQSKGSSPGRGRFTEKGGRHHREGESIRTTRKDRIAKGEG